MKLTVATLPRTLVATIVVITVVACAGNTEEAPTPTPARRGLDCPPATLTTTLGRDATGVRVQNDSGQALLLFLDECTGHRRLGVVRANRTQLFGLPGSVFLRGSQLILHSFTQDPAAYHSMLRHTPGPDTVRVVGTGDMDVSSGLELGDALFQVEQYAGGPRIVVPDSQARSTLRVFCADSVPVVEIGGLPSERGPFDVVLVFGSGERAPTNPWIVAEEGWIRSPAAFAGPILSRLRTNTSLKVQLQTFGLYITAQFNTTGMDEAIALLNCVSP